MRCRSTLHSFAMALVAGLFGHAAVQADPPPLEFVFSTLPNQAKEGSATAALGSGNDIDLLPNANLAYYSYVYNGDTKAHEDFTVVLSTAGDPKTVIATATVKKVAPKEIQLLVFKPDAKAAAVAPVPPAKTVDGAPVAPPKENPGVKLPQKLQLEVMETKNLKDPYLEIKAKQIALTLDPSIFFTAASEYKAADNDRTLNVRLTPTVKGKTLPEDLEDLQVKLDIRKDLIPSLDTKVPSEGNYEAVLAPGKEVILSAKNLKFEDTEKDVNWVAVSVHGFDRAFMFKISKAGSDPSPTDVSFLQLSLSSQTGYAVPGNPLKARIELYKTDEGKMPELTFDRGTGIAEVVTRKTFDKVGINSRDVKLYARFEDSGKIVTSSTVQDWSVDLNTKGVYGVGKFTLTTSGKDKNSKPAALKEEAFITFDDQAPVVESDAFRVYYPEQIKGKTDTVQIMLPKLDGKAAPARIEFQKSKDGKSKLRLLAKATINKAPIDDNKVLFFIGDPPAADGKPAPGSIVELGSKELPKWLTDPKGTVKLTDGWYTAEFDVNELKGKVKVGVQFVNLAGKATKELITREIVLKDPPPVRTTGDLKVTVTAGYDPERPQFDLVVSLLVDGKSVDGGKTDKKGQITFKDLKPGAYTVFSVNPGDGNARAFSVVKVIADEEVSTSLSLKR